MKSIREVMLSKIEDYFSGKLDRVALYRFAKSWDSSFLSKTRLEIEKLLVSDIIATLSFFEPDHEEAADDEEIQEMKAFLEGRRTYSRQMLLKIPPEIERRNIEDIKKVVSSYEENLCFRENDFDYVCDLKEAFEFGEPLSLTDVMYNDILTLVINLPYNKSLEIMMDTMLYVQQDETPSQEDVLNEIRELIECYEGNRILLVNLVFQGNTLVFNMKPLNKI